MRAIRAVPGARAVVSVMIIATVLTATTGSAGAAEANPDLDPSCDIDVSLVLDASGSIQGFGAVPDMRQLGLGLVEGLTDRGTRLGVVEFGTFADEPIPLTPVTGATAAEIFNPYFSGRASPSYYDGRVGRYTNWDDGLRLVAGKDERPDLVIFVSDGVPNTIGSQATAVANNGGTPAEAAGVAALHADALKAAGTHVLAVGVAGLNDAAGIDLLTSLSGDQSIAEAGPLAGDYFVGDFADLASTFDQLVRAMCGGTLLVRSVVDVDGDLTTTDDRVPAEGRPITVSSPDGTATLSRPETGPQGSVVVNFDWAHGATSVSSTITQSPPEGYYVATTNCAGADAPGTFDGGYTQRAVTVARTDTARCTFVNKELPAVLDFDLKVDRIVDVDGSGDNSVGDVIHYRAVAVNVGGAVLENVVIGSELVSWDTCSPDQGTDLGRAERLVCRGTLVIGGDPPPGAIVHLATAQADQIPVVADTELTVLPSARLAFDKEVIRVEDRDGSGDSSVGDVVHYRLTATNVGDANLTEVAVADPLIPDLSCIPAIVVVLSPGQRVVCDGTVTITADHLGSAVTNQAQATSRQTGIVRDGERLNVPDLGVRLNTMYLGYDDNDDNGAPSRGDEVRILNVATNTGGSMLSRTAVSDDRSRDLTCESVSPWLEPGVSRHCYGSYLVTRSDHGIDLGLRGRLTTAQLPDVTDTDTMPVPRAELDVQGSLYQLIDNDSSQDPSPGDVAVFRFGVTNVGEMTLTEVEFHQFGLVGVTCTGRADGRLGVGEFIECYGEHPITRSDVGTTVAPQGRASSWQAIEDTSVVELPVGVPDASIDMVVLRIVDTDEDGRTSVGDRIEYRVTVTNTGTANLA
ncbi:MAG: VWA domain-containing protein, partial [Acidimicrobiia bacterium]|nr:VWA domain-containing protein [Acidimicrobiia bacterium]